MIEALDSDYARTAYLKGLPVIAWSSGSTCSATPSCRRSPCRRPVSATSSAASSPSRCLFNYQGLGSLTLEAARQKDLPLLTAGVLVIGIVYLVVTLIADILYAFLNPRIRFGDDTA